MIGEQEVRDALPRVVRILASWCGDLDVAEDLASEALARAVALPASRRPERLAAWCVQVGRRAHLDQLRRDARLVALQPELARRLEQSAGEVRTGLDDRLALLFCACDPLLTPHNQMVLALRLVCGLSVGEVATHLGLGEAATAARLTRAKRDLARLRGRFEVPGPGERAERLPVVLDCVAALHTVAQRAVADDDLAASALSLADGLVAMHPRSTEAHGLRAVVLLGLARWPARLDAGGVALTLAEVDRTRWDPRLVEAGLREATVAMRGQGRFALEAAISGLHTTAPSVAATDWAQLVVLYDALARVWPSPAVEVAALAARTRLPGAELPELEARLETLTATGASYARRDAAFVLADLRWRTGRREEAAVTYTRLGEQVGSAAVRAFCERRVSEAT